MLVSALQSSNVLISIFVMFCGSVTFVSALHPKNRALGNFSRRTGSATSVSAVHMEKALFPIFVTLLGTVMLVIAGILWKA